MGDEFGEVLRKCDLFTGLDDGSLEMLYPGCMWVRLGAGDTLFHEGAPGGSLYIIKRGEIAIERIRLRGDDREDVVTLSMRRENEVIGELSLFDEGRRTATARATKPTVLLMIDGRYILRSLERSHHLAVGLLKAVMNKLKQAISQQADQRMAPINVRLARHILELMENHGEPDPLGGIRLGGRVTQADLGRRIGCSREMVNRVLQEFGEGVIESTRGQLIVRRPRRIRTVAERPY